MILFFKSFFLWQYSLKNMLGLKKKTLWYKDLKSRGGTFPTPNMLGLKIICNAFKKFFFNKISRLENYFKKSVIFKKYEVRKSCSPSDAY